MEDGMVDMFDHIEDLLDFPGDEDVFGLLEPCGSEGDALLLPRLPVPDSKVLGDGVGEESLDGFTVPNRKSGIEFSKEDDKLDHWDELDIVQLEWMSNFLDDSESFSLGLTGGVDTVDKSLATSYDSHGETKAIRRCYFRTSSPVSVLEANTNVSAGGIRESYSSSSAYSSSSTTASHFIGSKKDARASPPPLSPPDQSPAALLVPARARTKRGRPAAYSPLLHVRVIPCSTPVAAVPSPLSAAASYACAYTSDPESFGESSFRAPPQPPPNKKSKKTHPTGEGNDSGPPAAVRKCMHCAITKTPQWRAGPLGPKTLCNACGVRYKSGRLFPEYRPAGSPTFVPSVHSNSHKKVVEMRMKAKHSATVTDGCDLLEYIRGRA